MPWRFRALPGWIRWLRGLAQRPPRLTGPVLRRSALLTDRCERPLAFPTEVRWLRDAFARDDVFVRLVPEDLLGEVFGICFSVFSSGEKK